MRGKMSERILVVDDHPLTRDALASLLTQGGFDVVGEAADGAEALGLAHELQPDLVLLDDHLSTDDIAKRLFISEHTVRSHVKSMLRKLGVSSRRDALEQLALARR